jgi:hypothetical protein
MLEIRTHIDIAASASLVWGILIDFGSYRRWNPLIRSIVGQALVGNSIQVTQDVGIVGVATLCSDLTLVRELRELRWLGRWTIPGIHSAERRFGIESLPRGGVRFHHSERYRGIVVQFRRRLLQQVVEPAFGAMNVALKRRAERAEGPALATLGARHYADQDRRG